MKQFYLLIFFFLAFGSRAQKKAANDCINYIQVCGNQNISLNPSGYGLQEIGTNVCNSVEHNSLWLKFTVVKDGTLGFDLIPKSTAITIDYDFWVFGPNASCGNLGTSIRCSTTNPQASGATDNHTGMRDTEPDGDFFEGPGRSGDNYVKSLNVKAGESYFLVLDRPIGSSEFTLIWTGSARLENPFENKSFTTSRSINICGPITYDFTTLTTQILSGFSGFNVGYFKTFDDASYAANEITAPQLISAGKYYYRIWSPSSECYLTGEITVNEIPTPVLDTSKYNSELCDRNLDGRETVRFSDITPVILQDAANYTVTYALESNPATALPDSFTFDQDTFVLITVTGKEGCKPVTGRINFRIKPALTLTKAAPIDICDNSLSGRVEVDLLNYSTLLSSVGTFTAYNTADNARNAVNPVGSTVSIGSDATFYLRFETTDGCPAVGELNFKFKQSRKSDMPAEVIVCPEADALLDAGSGYDSYLWNTGATTQSIAGAAGNYFVDLTLNGCTYRQNVVVKNAEVPSVTVNVNGNTAEVSVKGGEAPYRYSLDGTNWQSENVFQNLSRGIGQLYVQDARMCVPVTAEFLVVNLSNAITPNGDGMNDVLDFSDLRIKKEVKVLITDRFGKKVYDAGHEGLIWRGTHAGHLLPTGTYWYVVEWLEPADGSKKQYKGWILLKNR